MEVEDPVADHNPGGVRQVPRVSQQPTLVSELPVKDVDAGADDPIGIDPQHVADRFQQLPEPGVGVVDPEGGDGAGPDRDGQRIGKGAQVARPDLVSFPGRGVTS